MYGIDRSALDRAGPDDRHLDRQVLQALRPGAAQRLHLRPTLDLEHAGGVGFLDAVVGVRIVIGDPREIDLLSARTRHQFDAPLDGREHSQAEQVDLQEPGVGARVLVPLDDLTSLHRCRHDRAATDQRPRGDDHPAGVLAQVTRQSVGLSGESRQPCPAALAGACGPALENIVDVLAHPARVPSFAAARHALDLPSRQPKRLAQLPDRAACPERRKGRHQGGAVVAIALVDARDQGLPDVAWKVEVDVRQRGQLLVQKAPDQQLVGDRIDVREAGQVADNRGHARASATPGRQ